MRLHDCESFTCENYYLISFIYLFFFVLLPSIRLPVPVSVKECMIDYLMETACIYICALLCLWHVKFYVPVHYHVN